MEDYSNAISSQQTELLLKQLNNIIYSVPCSYHAVHCPGLCYTNGIYSVHCPGLCYTNVI